LKVLAGAEQVLATVQRSVALDDAVQVLDFGFGQADRQTELADTALLAGNFRQYRARDVNGAHGTVLLVGSDS